jgi:putative ABC transport system permease protein
MLLQDLRYGARMLLKNPGFTLIAVITLALGIGANTAIFSVIKTVLLESLPFQNLDRIRMVWGRSGEPGQNFIAFSTGEFAAYRDRNQSFEQLAAFEPMSFNLVSGGAPEVIEGARATAGLFPLLGVRPLLGRTFSPAEDQPGRGDVALLAHSLWQRRFGADPHIIGQTLKLYRTPSFISAEAQPAGSIFTIIGVLPPGFRLPTVEAEVWAPRAIDEAQLMSVENSLQMIGRLKPGVTPAAAQAEMNNLAGQLKQEFPEIVKADVYFMTLQEHDVGDLRPTLLVLLVSVGLVLAIACANVANLLLQRMTARQREMATRLALGAGRGRLVRQLLTESLLLAALGGACGWLLAWWGVPLLVAASPSELLQHREVSMDLMVFSVASGITLLAGILCGLAPALHASRPDGIAMLKGGAMGATGGGRSRVRDLLVVSEVALALVILLGAGLIAKSLLRLQQVDPGFDPRHVLTARVSLPPAKYAPEQRAAFFRQVLERIRALPGVQAAGATTVLPLAGSDAGIFFTVEGQPVPPPDAVPTVNVRLVSPDYFRAMGIPTLRGQEFTEENLQRIRLIVSESLQQRYFPDEDPVGRGIKLNRPEHPGPFIPIIGVAKDVRQSGPQQDARPSLYIPLLSQPAMTLAVRTAGDPLALASAVRRAVLAVDAEQPIHDVRTLEQRLAEAVAQERFRTLLLGFFAGVALLLAAVGIYGVMAYAVSQRTREIGIRMALGAQAAEALKLVLRHGLKLALSGVALGLAGAFALTRLMSSLLFGVTPADPATFTAASLLLTAVALVACYVPAWRATKVDPMIALRHE